MPRREWLLLLPVLSLLFAAPATARPTPTVTVTATPTSTTPAPKSIPATPLPTSTKPSGWTGRINGKARPLAIEAVAVFAAVIIGYAYAVMRPSRRAGRDIER